ncbi:MAG: hypothetical protein VW338_17535 [Rhodospirillaceae bacterium]
MALKIAGAAVREGRITAVVTRGADGTVEHLGVVAYYHRNPLKRWAFAIRRQLGRLING